MSPQEHLDKAKSLISGDREEDYGPVESNHENIAALWTAYLGHPVSPRDVLLLMALLKVARTKQGKHKDDNYTDACGYLALAGSLGPPAREAIPSHSRRDCVWPNCRACR